MKITKELAKFLAEEGALTKFIDNYNELYHQAMEIVIRPINQTLINSIGTTFSWGNSPEGFQYWDDLHEKHATQQFIRFFEHYKHISQ
jgi:DNA-binding transcriptional MocR family regulator